ncbi:MAG: hypothetical protein KKD44_19720 [Proteobacteria bacterium]|nr:hypothetical protein [Pseudomonadota bacterium]
MKIDTLITIGVVIYIIISIRKALSHGKNEQGTAKPSGWKQKIQDMANQIKEEIEKANQQMQPNAPVPPLPMDDLEEDEPDNDLWSETNDEDIEAENVIISQHVLYEPKTSSLTPPPLVSHDMDDEDEDYRNRRIQMSEPTPQSLETVKKGAAYRHCGKKSLRRAVIWSEILAKPLALRDQAD